MKIVKLPTSTLENLINYLAVRPWNEVRGIISELEGLKIEEDNNEKEKE